ncbi:serine/threonine protein kinase, partial [bacterium]|nr:serine/threonine protein kinase [bacterium]
MTGALQGGTRLGPYTILGPLGKGGMGVVYKAQDERLGRLVAIKLLSRLFFVGEEGGVPFVVLEYLPGGSLKDLLKRKGALPPRRAASLGAQIARGLEAIHQMGLVHRDVKPENVLLDEEGHAKLSDFGLVGRSVEARVDATRALTKVGEMLGTLEYISPEQLEDSSQVDGRADLYGLGGLLYALLAGRPPFDGTGYVLVKKHLADRPRPPGELVGGIPPRLEGLVLRLLEKHPAARPASAALVAQELEAISRELEREKPRRRPLVVAGAALGAAGLALGAL